MYTIFDLFNDFMNDDKFVRNFITIPSNSFNKNVEKKTVIKNNEFNSGWVETEDSWYLYIMSPEADITVDEETIEVNFNTVVDSNGVKQTKKGYVKLNFPENSLPETIKAKKSDDGSYIKISMSKAIKDEKPKRKKITVE
jgi:hypothetical protein